MDRPRNVVVVVLDALRADRVGNAAEAESLTPNLDAIADSGTVFENAFTCASNTDPSVTSLLTGRYPLNTVYHHGKLVTDEEKRRVESTAPLPAVLSNAGWETAAVGQALDRWHGRGFDEYPGTDQSARLRASAMEVARKGFDIINGVSPAIGSTIRRLYNVRNREMEPDTIMQDYDPTALLSRVGSEPFFGFVHLMETHMPYLGTKSDFEDLLEGRSYPTETLNDFQRGRDITDEQIARVKDALDSLGLDTLGELLALYDASVRYADRKVGRLVDALERAGHWEDTALFVTADHGESLSEHGIYLDHHGLYDQVFSVPLITNLGQGRHIEDIVQLIDLAPSILDLLNVPSPPMDGESFLPAVSDEEGWQGRSIAFAEEAYTERRVGVRTERWKYVRHVPDKTIERERASSLECGYCGTLHGAAEELFDLRTDPGETTNVIDDHPDVVETLRSRYESFTSDLVVPEEADGDVQYDHEAELLDRLEAIGYR